MIAIIGGGPAGLRAAEVAVAGGASVTVYDAKASAGRKFLVAGGGGLNLTKAEEPERFAGNYSGGPDGLWRELIEEFSPEAMRAWAAGLGVETFVATSKRVYPKEMKAAPLLRRWVQRLRHSGVEFAMRHRWTGMRADGRVTLFFKMSEGTRAVEADAVILALGGGSWPETGSDGAWVDSFERCGVRVSPLAAANCGWEVAWPHEVLADAEGRPLKNILARAGNQEAAGELLITKYGLEGGAIYQLGTVLRTMGQPEIGIDFKPALDVERLVMKLGTARRNFLQEARQRWRLCAGTFAILSHHPNRGAWNSAEALARAVKNCRIELLRPRPLAEAISSAGGVCWSELDRSLMLNRAPGVFVAGEMIDWESPTGGYLMQGCFATATRAAQGALEWLKPRAAVSIFKQEGCGYLLEP